MPTNDTQEIEAGPGISRSSLPQIPKDKIASFLQILRKHGVTLSTKKIPAKYIKPLQNSANKAKLKQMQPDIFSFANDSFLVSKELYLLDGHHRWIILKSNNKDFPIRVIIINLPIQQLLKLAKQFSGSFQVDESDEEPEDSSLQKIADKLSVGVEELKKGIKVEKEHLKTIKAIQQGASLKNIIIMIALDHLKELPDYYSRLEKMEGK